MSKKEISPEIACRLGKVGGQAVIEGVMMKSADDVYLAVRKDDGTVVTKKTKFTSLRKKHKIFNLPLIRGVINFVEMMKLSMGTLNDSIDMLGLDDTSDSDSKFDKWLTEKLGDKFTSIIMGLGTVLGLALSVVLFVFIPTAVTKGIEYLGGTELSQILRSAIEGILKITIFVAYIGLVGLMPDIRRTFEYHGAEHKSVACYEKGLDLTPENAATCTRFHPRCGTSFIFVMILLSILIGMLIPIKIVWLRTLIKLALLPLSVGVGFEFIMFAGKHDNAVTRALSAPGLWMQRITTKEPDEKQLEVALKALKGAMPGEFPPEEEPTATEDTDSDEGTAEETDEKSENTSEKNDAE